MNNLLEVKNLEVSFHTYAGEVKAVRDISFNVREEEVLAIVGESGCGKSITAKSIIRLISEPPGEIKPGSQIIFNGQDVLAYGEKRLREYRGKECAIIFQDPMASLNPTMKIGKQIAENILSHVKMTREEAMNIVTDLLHMVGIDNPQKRVNQYPHELSGGMRQRVMIAIGFSLKPKLLIADEPTTALDVTVQSRVIELIRNMHREMHTSVILITHDLGIVADIAQNIIVMYAGKIVEKGSCRDIFYNPCHPYTIALLTSVPRLDMPNKQTLPFIKGTPPDLIAPPVGCPFAERCEYSMNICYEHPPEVTVFDESHEASCWLHHPQAQKMETPLFKKVKD
jgi:oligopeptide transport system ATP-binding protein